MTDFEQAQAIVNGAAEKLKRIGFGDIGYCFIVDSLVDGQHGTRTNMTLDSYLFAVFHTIVEIGQQRGHTKAEVLDAIRAQFATVEGEEE